MFLPLIYKSDVTPGELAIVRLALHTTQWANLGDDAHDVNACLQV